MLFFGATAPNLPCWFDSLDSVEVTSVLDPEFCIPQTSYTSASCCQTFTWPYTSVRFSILKTQYSCLVYVHIAVLLFSKFRQKAQRWKHKIMNPQTPKAHLQHLSSSKHET